MLERPQRFAFALIVAGLTCLSAGCTSNRLLKSDGFGWLGANHDKTNLQHDSDFPAPSSVEVPLSVGGQRNSLAGANSANGTNGGSMTRNANPAGHANASFANQNHPMIQQGLYATPAAPPVATASAAMPAATNNSIANQNLNQANNGSMYASSPVAAPSVPSPTGAYGTTNPAPANMTADAHQPPSMYKNTGALIGYEAPVNLPDNSTAVAPVAPATPVAPAIPAVPKAIVATTPAATPPAAPTSNSSGADFYQARATQPRPWRPGSTTNLKTL